MSETPPLVRDRHLTRGGGFGLRGGGVQFFVQIRRFAAGPATPSQIATQQGGDRFEKVPRIVDCLEKLQT